MRQDEVDVPAQIKRINSLFLYLFVLFRPSVSWWMPTHIGEENNFFFFNGYIFFFKFIWQCGILVSALGIFSCSMWDLVPWLGIKPGILHWEHRVLATGPSGKSQETFFTRPKDSSTNLAETSLWTEPQMFYQISGHPVAQSSSHRRLIIIGDKEVLFIWKAQICVQYTHNMQYKSDMNI